MPLYDKIAELEQTIALLTEENIRWRTRNAALEREVRRLGALADNGMRRRWTDKVEA
jgi:hypothetical protein